LVEDIITRMRTSKFFDDRYLRYLISSVDRTNGDILLGIFTPDGRQWVLVGDFTGHGLPAAVAAPLITHVFYSQASMGSSIETALEVINSVMCQQLPTNIFMAGCLLEISANRQEIKLWNAGMPSCISMQQGKTTRRTGPQILPFGISEQIDIQQECEIFEVQEGDRLYIFSDGVTEVANPQGELFGTARVEEYLSGLVADDKEIDEFLTCLESFNGHAVFFDDITLVEIRC
jgi:serine phosphatase RsbU (regulator of sigma subunit)